MSPTPRPTVDRRPGQSYWDRLREIDEILAARDTTSPEQRALLERWLETSPLSARRRPA